MVNFDKNVLSGVACLFYIIQIAKAGIENLWLISIQELFKGVNVSVFKFLYEPFVVHASSMLVFSLNTHGVKYLRVILHFFIQYVAISYNRQKLTRYITISGIVKGR